MEEFSKVSDGCTFGVEDSLLGEDVAIALVTADPSVLPRLYEFMRMRLAEHQMPRTWFLIDEIPRTSRGKINRVNVAAACAQLTPIQVSRV